MVEMKEVSFSYDKERKIYDGFCLSIENGESVGLIGANGAGKSTLMKLMLGLLPYEGDILVDGVRVEKKNLSKVRKKLGFVLQNSDNQMFMPTVLDDMMFGLVNYGMSREDAEKKADDVLRELGIEELKNRHNHRISGGEKKMAAIATVMAMEPSMILFDEPSASLDPFNRRKIIEAVKSLEVTKLIASHDLELILDTCSRVILLSGGKISADGSTEDILRDRELLEANRLELPFRYT